MDKLTKSRLLEVLKTEASYIMRSDEDIFNKIEKMNDIINLQKVLENYEELEPVLKKYFNENAIRKKWNDKER